MKNSTISESLYGFQKSQADINFLDRCLYGDVLAFLDYALIVKLSQQGDKLAREMSESVKAFIAELYAASVKSDVNRIDYLLNGLGETRYTGIGYASGNYDGNGVGKIIAESLREGLIFMNQAIAKGNYSYFTIPFALDNIRHDRSSDIITALTKSALIKYTEDLAISEGWTTVTTVIDNVYDVATRKWISVKAQLPIADGKPAILFPKRFINTNSHLDSIFRSFKKFLFDRYIKFDLQYAAYWDEGKDFITQKQFREILKSQGRDQKAVIREYVLRDYAIIDQFETALEKVSPMTDADLEMLQHCRVRNIA
ncbi:hypothetical protein [Sphingobacterium deserti]|uniref:Uncharacterized protein n=1 Tax=Sphingobacterium deserti TaxID=1229276 RepID=A0A0B8T1E9_9SPHI|nr:hypothetical protein [Sphingobacterium deserti]KGE14737.1 hypothetical protein DI53_1766 [Sphingobacterium deserti]